MKQKLFKAALKAQEHAHAPHSKLKVGTALMGDDGNVYTGCNVEFSVYGAGTCAERGAVAALVNGGAGKFTELVIVTDTLKPCPPCGICRQVLIEFAQNPNTVQVHLAGLKGIQKTFILAELLPHAFDETYLP